MRTTASIGSCVHHVYWYRSEHHLKHHPRGQILGTLEVVFTTQTSLATFLTGSALYAIVRSTVFAVVYLALGAALFGVSFAGAKRLGGAPGAVVEHERHAGPWDSLRCLHHGVQTGTPAAFLLRGVAYPVAVLPGWMQALSVVFPHTYALEPCG